jgi:hypothetical protein
VACINSSILDPKTGSLMATKQSAVQMHRMIEKGQLDDGLAFVFGTSLIDSSKRMSLEQMADEAEQVAEGARQMRLHQGHPEQQRRIVQGMDEEAAAALCKWIREPEAASKVLMALRH